jgi:hypothetical protein
MNKEAKNMEAIAKAKAHHDANCPWGGEGKRIYMTGFDIERMGWEEGDTIAGLTIIASTSVATGRFRVECDAEPKPDEQITEEVEDKDLVYV